LSSSCVLCT